MTDFLFVYGTLLKGEVNNYLIHGCDLVDYIKIDGSLYDTGLGFPALFRDNSGNSAYGELYKLPAEYRGLLKKLDNFESTDSGLYKRSFLIIKDKKLLFYEGKSVRKTRLIRSGSWLMESPPLARDHSRFAVNFEDHQKKHYRKIPDGVISDNIYLPGNIPVLVTSPHSTTHKRYGKLKRYEIYTAAIATILHAVTGAHALYSNCFSEIDPNYYNNSPFKNRLDRIITYNDIRMVLDLHGTGEEKFSAIYPGMGREREFLKNNTQLIDIFYQLANIYNIDVGSEQLFPATRQDTVAKYCAYRDKVVSIQLEINKNYRKPLTNPDKFNTLIEFTSEFINRSLSFTI